MSFEQLKRKKKKTSLQDNLPSEAWARREKGKTRKKIYATIINGLQVPFSYEHVILDCQINHKILAKGDGH